jgi:hypothetical protein
MLGGVPTRRRVSATMLQFTEPSTNELVSGISLTRLGGLFYVGCPHEPQRLGIAHLRHLGAL